MKFELWNPLLYNFKTCLKLSPTKTVTSYMFTITALSYYKKWFSDLFIIKYMLDELIENISSSNPSRYKIMVANSNLKSDRN